MKSSNNNIVLFIKALKLVFLLTLWVSVQSAGYAQKKAIKLNVEYYNDNDQVTLLAKAKMRVGRKYESIDSLEVIFYLNEETDENRLGNVTTNENGEARFNPSKNFYKQIDTLSIFTIIASVTNQDKYKDKQSDLTIQKGNLVLTTLDLDTVKYIVAKVVSQTDSGMIPVNQLQVKFFVKRLFGLLPIGGEYNFTDEKGTVKMVFPESVPGNEKGELEIISKIIDHETMGNISKSLKIDWGQIPAQTNFLQKRTMWSARDKAPMAVMIVPNLLLAGAWGVIIYLIYLLYKINQHGMFNKTK